jgi:hypothetical protein
MERRPYLLGANFFPIGIILEYILSEISTQRPFENTYFQDTTFDHNLHTVWWNACHLIDGVFEDGRGEIGI